MHPPLYQPHPLCKQEVEALVKCHEENPYMKFLNACQGPKTAMDACFREEKKLRKKLNKRVESNMPSALVMTRPLGGSGGPSSSSSSGSGGGSGTAPAATGAQ